MKLRCAIGVQPAYVGLRDSTWVYVAKTATHIWVAPVVTKEELKIRKARRRGRDDSGR